MICIERFCLPGLDLLMEMVKALVGFARLFRPRYALANLGHPSSSYWVLLGDRLLPVEFSRNLYSPTYSQSFSALARTSGPM
jgi:hypothetical protein